jgi:hypothetical protein
MPGESRSSREATSTRSGTGEPAYGTKGNDGTPVSYQSHSSHESHSITPYFFTTAIDPVSLM